MIPARVEDEDEEDWEEDEEEKGYPEPCWLACLARNDVLQCR